MDLDDVYIQIGEFGSQQKIFFLSLCLFNLYAPLHLIQTVFTGQTPNFVCTSNATTYNNTCPDNHVSNCESIEFSRYPDSFGKEWSLVCNEAYKSKLVQSFFMAGVGIGAITLGTVADNFGRRRTLACTLIGMIITGIGSSFVPWYLGYLCLRFITGVFSAGNILSSFVLASELVGPSYRGMCGNIFQAFFAFGIIIYSGMAYFISSWRVLSFAATSVGLPYLFLFILLPESPRWLIAHERTREAKQILRQVADRNGMIFPSDLEISVPLPNAKKGSLIDVFRKRKTAISTIIQIYSWFVNSCVYYGLTLASDSLGSNIFVSTMLSGIVELPAYVIAAILIDWIGRKLPLSVFMVLGGVSCFTIQFLSPLSHYVFILALVGKLCIAASFGIIYIHTAELFPTVFRQSGLGLCSLSARIGGISAPFISLLKFIPALQFTIFGLMSLTSGLLNLFLDETLNRTLPETFEDMKGERSNLRNERGRYNRLASEELEESDDDNSTTVFEVNRIVAT